MSARVLPHDLHGGFAQLSPAEALVAAHVDRACSLFRLFIDDPRVCFDRVEAVFRALSDMDDPCAREFYALIVDSILRLENAPARCGDMPPDSLMCLLLKEHAGLSYGEIAEVLGLDRGGVRDRIAEARMAALA